ncbi:DUF1846 domain-containing protein [Sedimentibacter sp. zth1]|uniref:DUF1846 domain-containing protein n=1 Tax=Sedimentibacter sp. zth1 TaxID=2816908 RepID=UPI001A92FC2F|nr:DUF1846 domain-containing protein [Sedimentibacter sp. zth1]QSX06193.1 DUF1846 domain-containing protein [Sedimentibacter sp. zth1]
MKIGFDHEKYLQEQSKYILERVNNYQKLYLEFGGKLISDLHAKRVLPGFDEDAKIKLLQKLKDKVEIIICVYAGDIERNKIRGDLGITYDLEVLRTIDNFKFYGLEVNSVVITRYDEQPSATIFMNKLGRRGIKVYTHTSTKGYPTDVDTIVSDEGYGKNPYIETKKPIVVVTAPGPGNGKLSTCLNQLYHEYKRGNMAGYSKFETFPVWNIPLKHPLNVAYEAATVDLKDVNMIDSFHLDAYNEITINYNRDIESFPVLKRIIEKITGEESVYKSPTDMGVNRVGFGIIDDEIIKEASLQEIIRRYFKTACEYKKGYIDFEVLQRIQLIMNEMKLKEEDRVVVMPAREYARQIEEKSDNTEICPVAAIELENGTIITGKGSSLMCSTAAVILNAIKYYAKIDDSIHLISPVILEPILKLKRDTLKIRNSALNCQEVLTALSICAVTNQIAELTLKMLEKLNGCIAHSTTIIENNDEQTLRRLGIDITCDPIYSTDNLYYN